MDLSVEPDFILVPAALWVGVRYRDTLATSGEDTASVNGYQAVAGGPGTVHGVAGC